MNHNFTVYLENHMDMSPAPNLISEETQTVPIENCDDLVNEFSFMH
jgi:hypothetical protein